MRRVSLAVCALAAGCADPPGALEWEIRFADDGIYEAADAVEATILRGDCESGDALYRVWIPLPVGGPEVRRPPALGPGAHGFQATATDSDCRIVGRGCTVVDLPRSGDRAVVSLVASVDPVPLCPPSECRSGACEDGGECAEGLADCNDDPEDGCEADLSSPSSCGSCGHRCDGATPLCEGGRCVATCADPDATNCGGACVDTERDRLHCGGCDTPCAPPHARGECRDGSCRRGDCDDDWGDCNRQDDDGCETSLTTALDCDGCEEPCDPERATAASCASGECEIQDCEAGWADCNEDAEDGCEALLSSSEHCGGCGQRCELPHATTTCVEGECELPLTCDDGWASCDGDDADGCERSIETAEDCGDCGVPCGDLEHTDVVGCVAGECVPELCAAGWGDCDGLGASGCEEAVAVDDCCGLDCVGRSHVATAECAGGVCQVLGCDAGFADCNADGVDGCESELAVDPNNCGACGERCEKECCNRGKCCG